MKKNHKFRTSLLSLLIGSAAAGVHFNTQADTIKEACPNPIVIQTDWFPTPERGMAYQLAGTQGVINPDKGSYTGELGNTGVQVEIRAGGPFVGFSSPTALMYQDPSIMLGFIQTDQVVENYARQPTMSVMATLDINPQVLMYDPSQYKLDSIADIGKTDANVLYFEGLPFVDFLVAKGMLRKEQVDASHDGSPARFIASGGKDIVMGYASNEPYRYENEIKHWKKPVSYLLINDAGYEIYPQNFAVRPEVVEQKKDCLKELVPMMQQALVDYSKNPTPINNKLIEIAETLKVPVPLSEKSNAYAVKTMHDLKLISNGHNEIAGDFDMDRLQRVIDKQLPAMLSARGKQVPEGLKASDLHTNEFIDPSIGI